MTLVPHDSSPHTYRGTLWPLLTAAQPLQSGDHCSSSLGLLRPAMRLPNRPCQAVFTFLTPGVRLALEGRCPSRLSVHSHTYPVTLFFVGASRDFAGRFQWLASEAKPLCYRGSPSAPMLLFLGIIRLLSSPLYRGLLCRRDRECMSVPPGPLIWD